MKTLELTWTSFDGIPFYGCCWQPEKPPKAVIGLVHGLGEHVQRYEHVAAALAEKGYALVGMDLRGHGRSGGPRGHAPSFESFMKDIDRLFVEIDRLFPGLPRFIYGHSLGGILTLNYVLRRRPAFSGAVVTSPGLHTALELQKVKVTLAKVLGSVMPTGGLPSGLDAAGLSHDARVVDTYRKDPLVHDQVSFGMAKGLLEAIGYAFGNAREFALPLLLMHGTQDPIAFPSSSTEYAQLVTGDCTLKLWEGCLHELHNEPQKAEVFQYLLAWLEKH